jgi:hypothetical protein
MRPRLTVHLLSATLLATPLALAPTSPASAQIGIGVGIGVGVGLSIGLSAHIAPPPLPVYEPPPLPGEGYLWVPGYWAYGDAGYYWVPGTWILPPRVGLLWTPCYWGWSGGVYAFHAGYWGPHVGFYGGINYGFGYTGNGFFGGEWRNGGFAYNTAVYHNFGGVHVTNVYNQTIINRNVTNVSFNGPNGVQARPTPAEESYARETHVAPPAAQIQHAQSASHEHALLASVNGGHPAIAAVARPAVFHGPGVVAAHEAAAHVPLAAPGHSPVPGGHAGLPEVQRPSGPAHSGLQPHAAIGGHPTPPGAYHLAPEHRAAPPPHEAGPVHPAAMARPAPRPTPRPAPHAAPARHEAEPRHH